MTSRKLLTEEESAQLLGLFKQGTIGDGNVWKMFSMSTMQINAPLLLRLEHFPLQKIKISWFPIQRMWQKTLTGSDYVECHELRQNIGTLSWWTIWCTNIVWYFHRVVTVVWHRCRPLVLCTHMYHQRGRVCTKVDFPNCEWKYSGWVLLLATRKRNHCGLLNGVLL